LVDGGVGQVSFTILNLSCSGCMGNGLFNTSLTTTFSAILIGLKTL